MGVKKIFIIHDENYTKAQILEDMRAEGFRNKYKFFTDVPSEMIPLYLKESDEVWTFGHVEGSNIHKLALEFGADVWRMS